MKETTLLTREQILQTQDRTIEELDMTPFWPGHVFVRSLMASEKDNFEKGLVRIKGNKREMNLANARARFAALVVCDAEGNPIFSEFDTQDLGRKNAAAIERIWKVGQRLSGYTDEEFEDLVKNSEATPED